MHIVDGVLSAPVLIGGAAVCAGGLALGLRRLQPEQMPLAGLLAAVFFVASFIHVPVGPSSVHLVMNGLAGLLLGWAAFPVMFVGLVLQALMFGYGGITVLGVNAVNIALPAVLLGLVLRPLVLNSSCTVAVSSAVTAGGLAIALTALMVGLSLAFSGEAFVLAAKIAFIAHLPVMLIEAAVTGVAVWFIVQVKPDLLRAV